MSKVEYAHLHTRFVCHWVSNRRAVAMARAYFPSPKQNKKQRPRALQTLSSMGTGRSSTSQSSHETTDTQGRLVGGKYATARHRANN